MDKVAYIRSPKVRATSDIGVTGSSSSYPISHSKAGWMREGDEQSITVLRSHGGLEECCQFIGVSGTNLNL